MKIVASTFLLLFTLSITAQKPVKNTVTRIDPAFWWAGMKNPNLELLVYHPEIGGAEVSLNYPGVRLAQVEPAKNKDFLYLKLVIDAGVQPGTFPITFKMGKKNLEYYYELKARRSAESASSRGVRPSDFIYLIMPDRFSNGDPSNDIVKGTREPSINRDSMYWRHGGDLQGVINKLDYLNDLGITAIWLNPVHENNQPKYSYHGYAITDHYKIDSRLGNNELYQKFSEEAHRKGMKVVMDIVPNHIGDEHWLFKNLPDSNWVNWWPKFTRTNYRAPLLLDPYASQKELDLFARGWFDTHMPDLNQRDPHLAKYLTQSYIWWAEYAGVDDFRIDTYSYPDQEYMAQMAADILLEYPGMNMFGEIWEHSVPIQSFFATQFKNRGSFDSKLPAVLDFQIYKAINEALTKPFNWTDGVSAIYYTLAEDLLYKHPQRNVTFLDNHDLSRFYSVIGEDIRKFKMGIGFLLTMRGIPSMYYGTEVLMTGISNPDGWVRMDFKGGWPGDKQDKFQPSGRSAAEQDAFSFTRTIANWRKKTTAVQNGKLMQFIPEKGVYVYFRYDANSTVMVVMNTNDKKENLGSAARFDEMLNGKRSGKDVLSGNSKSLENLELNPWEILIFEL
jgi:glycosidase